MNSSRYSFLFAVVPALLLAACTHPLNRSLEARLQEQLRTTTRQYIESIEADEPRTLTRQTSNIDTKLDPELRGELDAMSGPTAYNEAPLQLGNDLRGVEDGPTIAMSLRHAIHEAVASNLNIRIARLQPAVNDLQILQAEAAFDATFFSSLSWQKLNTPRPLVPGAGAFSAVGGSLQQETLSLSTGIRKFTSTGGQLSASTTLVRDNSNPSTNAPGGQGFTRYDTNIELSINQPLLRNFGSDVNRAQINLSANARNESVADLKTRLLELVQAVEETYWTLVFARHRLLIQNRLLERTIIDRDQVDKRQGYDATPAQVTEANSFVETRRAEVIRARQDVRRTSDALKRLINSPSLPVSTETQVIPLETPADIAISFSLRDSVSSALQSRPELQRALLEIDDAAIRQRVADNQRLPVLDLSGTIRYNGLGFGNAQEAYEDTADGDFIDYIIGAQFELPIGNRAAEGLYSQRQIESRASVINYQRVSQDVVVEVKNALRDLKMAYQLIDAERVARRAAAENLRALEAQERAGEALTPEFLDLKLRRQEALAAAELREMQALIDYNIAISNLYRTMGTLLDRNGIDFADAGYDPQH